jgi:hypothetical protein
MKSSSSKTMLLLSGGGGDWPAKVLEQERRELEKLESILALERQKAEAR